MRDPRLSSPSPQRVHQDVFEYAPHDSMPSTSHAPFPVAHPHAPTTESFLSNQPHFSSSSSRSTRNEQVQWMHSQRPAQPHPRSDQYSSREQYLQQPARPQQPATIPIHRVYVLRCATCDTFLSDRGMRAVLLLKPHIVLFSTDAAPANSETFWPGELGEEEHVERTCSCLTSSINCHGCGKTVGYHIVSPCAKCTASVQKHQRTANHHRYVFHHNEVTSRERMYFPDERGVNNPFVARSSALVATSSPNRHCRSAGEEAADAASSARSRHGERLLKAGDTLYWHLLIPGGERCQSIDPRTREPVWSENVGR
ncbi:hypothetical protein NBRC10512_006575 [Rhodotorula toruloides]|uniref:RHTO0S10e05578g1_1 n=2 Tax=Rhodotorula toruloides TaxID=5286 RepID=A0A061B6Z5_RHOTO|nr:zinc finger, C2H2-type domain containing protein [Rhodotorula toruloides NP11]EMS22754.1 zinc finger, C2H2-type domain containing protein [Rhodotorula toruloides NP11]KAJ8293066.1 Protein FAM72A [Rhodotorula toruloides]CDR45151.1 RHTO0S10e05578g1_1 [Rhodotorula toruloides]